MADSVASPQTGHKNHASQILVEGCRLPHQSNIEMEKVGPDKAQEASPREAGLDIPSEKPPAQMNGWSFRFLMISITLGALLIALNATVLGTVIPAITNEFNTVEDVGWYAAAFLIANTALAPLVGRLYETFRLKPLYITFVAIFELGSLLAAVSRSSAMLIVGRAVSGIGGAGILNGGQSILAATVPIAKRSFLNGIILGCFALGQAIGPLIGGALTQAVSWRWCFYINLPIGGIVAFLFMFIVKLPVTRLSEKRSTWRERILEIDLVGFFIFAGACVSLLLGLQWGGTRYPWASSSILCPIITGLVAFVPLGWWFVHKGDDALIPPRLLRSRVNFMIIITSLVQSGGTILALYWLPLWFQAIQDAGPFQSGVFLLPTILSQLVASVICGGLVQRTGYYLPEAIFGNALVAIGAGLTSTLAPTTSLGAIISYQILLGAGRGSVLQLLVLAIQANSHESDASIASAVATFAQFLGGAFFTSIAKTIFTTSLVETVHQYAPNVDPVLVIDSGVTEIMHVVPQEELGGVLLAYNKALNYVFYLQLGAALVAFISSWGMGWVNLKEIRREGHEELLAGSPLAKTTSAQV